MIYINNLYDFYMIIIIIYMIYINNGIYINAVF